MNTPEKLQCAVDQEEEFVVDYLYRHRDFFAENQDLLLRLRIPHQSGKAVSLLEKQVSVLREKHASVNAQLKELMEVAVDNEKLDNSLHKLACATIKAKTLEELQSVLAENLRADFAVDCLAFHFKDESLLAHATEESYQPGELAIVRDSMAGEDILCGRISEKQRSGLFGSHSTSIESAALIWLHAGDEYGLMALGSENPDHFSADKGTVFLGQVKDLVASKLFALRSE